MKAFPTEDWGAALEWLQNQREQHETPHTKPGYNDDTRHLSGTSPPNESGVTLLPGTELMDIFDSVESRRRFVIAAAGVLVVSGGLYLLVREYLPFLTSSNELRAFVAGYGVLAPLVFIGLQAAQVLLAPIPGQVTGFVSGYLFGGLLGTIYSLVGVTIGSSLAFWLSRRYGRPFVENVIHEDVMQRFDAFVDEAGLLSLFVMFLIPGLPDDILCFMGGLTDIELWKLITVMFVGRVPAYVLINVSGSSLADNNLSLAVVLLLVMLGFSVWGFLRRDRIMDRLKQLG